MPLAPDRANARDSHIGNLFPEDPLIPLEWSRCDLEQRCFFRGGRHTATNNVLTFTMAALGTVVFFSLLLPFHGSRFADMFVARGPTPYAIVFLTCWSLAILFAKWSKLSFQRRALGVQVVPAHSDFILSPDTSDFVLKRLDDVSDDPKNFVLFNRIASCLANLRNLGRVADFDEMLRSHAAQDESSMETSYSLVNGFIWAIPVLGFIGTVLGLSDAIGAFGSVLRSSTGVDAIKNALQGVTAGLSTAFETTLEALVAALALQLLATFLKTSEQEFLDMCSEHCSRQLVARLRLLPFEVGESA